MSKWNKLIDKLLGMPNEMRYEELKRILEHYGYVPKETKSGSSHVTFRKKGCTPITLPRHGFIPRVYVQMVRKLVEEEEKCEH